MNALLTKATGVEPAMWGPSIDGYDELLARLGPHTTGVSCLYVKRLADVDSGVLAELLTRSVEHVRGRG